MSFNNIAKFIFVYMLAIQTANMVKGSDLDTILIFKFTLFEIGILLGLAMLSLKLNTYAMEYSREKNNLIFTLLIVLFIYQVIVISPLLYLDNYSLKEIGYQVFRKSHLLIILFFYWWLIPSFENIESSIKLIQLTSVILIALYLYNYSIGYYEYTSTGELRVAPGVTTLLFGFILITSFSFYSGTHNNLFLILISVIGLVFANHKSAYLGVFIITLITLVNMKRLKNRTKIGLQVVLFLFIIIIPLSEVNVIKDNFIGRVTSSFTREDPNAESRFLQYKMAWDYFKEHPLNGSKDNLHYYKDKSFDNIPPHSFVIQILSTQGVIGFVMIMSIVISILIIGYRNRNDALSFQMFLFIIYYLVFTLLNENFFSQRNILLLDYAAAMILYRNKCIESAKVFITPILAKELMPKYAEGINH